LVFQLYDTHLDQLSEIAERACRALNEAGIPYRIVGGLAVFLHVRRRDPMAARLTRDADLAISCGDLEVIAQVVRPLGLNYRHVAGVDMLVDAQNSVSRSAIHFVTGTDFSTPADTEDGILLASVPDLLRMKLTSFRLRDKVHIADMDSVGLITPEIERSLSQPMQERLRQVRAEER
jgi:hypothetical protein